MTCNNVHHTSGEAIQKINMKSDLILYNDEHGKMLGRKYITISRVVGKETGKFLQGTLLIL